MTQPAAPEPKYLPTDEEMKEAHDGVEPWCDREAEWEHWLSVHDASVRDRALEASAAELERTKLGARELGRLVERFGREMLEATGRTDLVNDDGDGDWQLVSELLAELRPRAEAAEQALADERARRPDRSHLLTALAAHRPSRWRSFDNDHMILRCCGVDFGRLVGRPRKNDRSAVELWEEHLADAVLSSLALETEAREEDEDQLNRAEHEPLAYDGTHVGGPDYNEARPTVIARLEVTRGDLTEYPIAEKVRGGWQNGVTFYPDADVTQVKVPYAPAPEVREVTDAEVAGSLHKAFAETYPDAPGFTVYTSGPDAPIWQLLAGAVREATHA